MNPVVLRHLDRSVPNCTTSFTSGGAQFPGFTSPGIQNFVRWQLKYVDFSVLNMLHVSFLASVILRWLQDFWKVYETLDYICDAEITSAAVRYLWFYCALAGCSSSYATVGYLNKRSDSRVQKRCLMFFFATPTYGSIVIQTVLFTLISTEGGEEMSFFFLVSPLCLLARIRQLNNCGMNFIKF